MPVARYSARVAVCKVVPAAAIVPVFPSIVHITGTIRDRHSVQTAVQKDLLHTAMASSLMYILHTRYKHAENYLTAILHRVPYGIRHITKLYYGRETRVQGS